MVICWNSCSCIIFTEIQGRSVSMVPVLHLHISELGSSTSQGHITKLPKVLTKGWSAVTWQEQWCGSRVWLENLPGTPPGLHPASSSKGFSTQLRKAGIFPEKAADICLEAHHLGSPDASKRSITRHGSYCNRTDVTSKQQGSRRE